MKRDEALHDEFAVKTQQRRASAIHNQVSNLRISLHFGDRTGFLKRYFVILPIAVITIILSIWMNNIYVVVISMIIWPFMALIAICDCEKTVLKSALWFDFEIYYKLYNTCIGIIGL